MSKSPVGAPSRLGEISKKIGGGDGGGGKVHYNGIFTKAPGRKYIDGIVAYVDDVDTDLFSVHELDDMVRELGYKTEQTLYYQFCIPEYPLDYGLMCLGNDQDVLKMVSYVPKHRLIMVYIENGQTRVLSYYKSPSKVVIEELELDSVSSEINRKKPSRREAGSYVDEGHDYSKSILPYIRSQVYEQMMNHEVETEELVGTYHVEEPSWLADDGVHNATIDEFEPFVEDYSVYADYDAEDNVQTSCEHQPEVDYLEGMLSDDSGEAFYYESGYGSEGSGDDYDDSDYNVDESNIHFDVDVDMIEFHNVVYVDEHGILINHSTDEGNDMIDNDLEFVGFHEDDMKRMLKELSKSSRCSHGEVNVFKTKCDVKNFMDTHAVEIRSLYLAKNDKIRIRVKSKGVVSQSSKVVDSGGPLTRSRAKCKGKYAVQISRANENQDWLVKTVQDKHKCRAYTDCLLNKLCERVFLKSLCVVQKEIDKFEGLLTPTTTTVFDKIKTDATKFVAKYIGARKYQVFHVDMLFVLYGTKLKMKKMPHMLMNGSILARLSTWKAMYFNKIDPLNGRSMWPKSDYPFTLNPPKHKTQVGRPKKKRRRGVDELNNQAGKLSRKYLTSTCSKCHNKGHNSKTCKGKGGSGEVGG
uniref:PB1-like domain-containing protein n=1 Tax=Lactuca sativa TaxID=4236 RepID=A0A9R1X886_LACSA|nr:hypothetical protein LSAT_V11C600303020 [Lactuca sativa]